jgi:hypothetical protein
MNCIELVLYQRSRRGMLMILRIAEKIDKISYGLYIGMGRFK